MGIDSGKAEKFSQVFRQVAEILNQCAPEERAAVRADLGDYTHDLKHILGVVLGAQTLMAYDKDLLANHGDELEIIARSAKDLNSMFELLIQNLSNEIMIEE